MNQQEALVEIGRRITPVLQEFGVEGCVFVGYIRLGDGNLEKILAVNLPPGDVSQGDGLRPVIAFTSCWAGERRGAQQPPI